MSLANPLWGTPHIHGELLKLGIQVAQVGRARWQVKQGGASGLNQLPYSTDFVRGQIVQDHDIVGFQLGTQNLFQVGEKDVSVGGRFDGHNRYHAARLMAPSVVRTFQCPCGVASTIRWPRSARARHLDKMAKVTMLTGMIVSYAYATEFFSAWYSGNLYERYHFINRATGAYAWCFYLMVLCNVITPHLLWTKKARTSVALLFVVSILVNMGMWFERFVIIVVSLHRAFLPSGWGMFYPTVFDVGILIGSFGLFFTCFLLFIRFLPMVAMWEIKGVVAHGAHKMALSSDEIEDQQVAANA